MRESGMALNVVIMAAGKGTRMKSARPKVLHKLAGRILLQHVLDAVAGVGDAAGRHTIVITGHGAEQVEAACAGQGLQFARQMPQLGTGHAVQQAVPVLAEAHETTLVLIKPDGVARGLIGEIVGRIERKGYVIERMDLRTLDRTTAERHYAEHTERPFFGELVEFITSAPLVAMQVSGEQAVAGMRNLMGATDPVAAAPGTMRGDLATVIGENIVHGSDSTVSAERELGIFFGA
jgi:nucleoside-diphosphate kinase